MLLMGQGTRCPVLTFCIYNFLMSIDCVFNLVVAWLFITSSM